MTPVAFRETAGTTQPGAMDQAKQQALLSRRGMAVAEKKVRQSGHLLERDSGGRHPAVTCRSKVHKSLRSCA